MKEQNCSNVSVMSFNILYGGTHFGQPLKKTAEVIDIAGPDIVVLCEEMGSARLLASQLGWWYHEVIAPPYRNSVAILSRFKTMFFIGLTHWSNKQ